MWLLNSLHGGYGERERERCGVVLLLWNRIARWLNDVVNGMDGWTLHSVPACVHAWQLAVIANQTYVNTFNSFISTPTPLS